MNDIAIRVENLSKQYKIGAKQARYLTFRESIVNSFTNYVNTLRIKKNGNENYIWALRDINFKVNEGEVLGIIGRNGAGKSTLLKILARITKPSTGRLELNGRVGSLLEVGTGFHPELTGRENIYLNGAILGMHRKEINQNFDEIVDFAEIEAFLDTPAKHYSSGMYMRLAFAVAAHLDPEILLIDEVLAVGDGEFQKKCLNKMGDIANTGRTVLFVSHNLAAVNKLCTNTIVLEKGKIKSTSPSNEAIKSYLESFSQSENNWSERSGSQRASISSIELSDKNNNKTNLFSMGDSVKIDIQGSTTSSNIEFSTAIQLVSLSGMIVLYGANQFFVIKPDKEYEFRFQIVLEKLMIMPGDYLLNIWIGKTGIEEYDYLKGAAKISVFQSEKLPVTHSVDASLGLFFAEYSIFDLKKYD